MFLNGPRWYGTNHNPRVSRVATTALQHSFSTVRDRISNRIPQPTDRSPFCIVLTLRSALKTEEMSVITPAFTSLTSFGSLSEDSRKFQSEVDQLWADMQASVFKTRAHESPKVPSDKEAKEPAKETKEDPTEKAGRQSPKEATTSFSEMEDLWPGRNTSIFHLRPSISKDEIRSTATAADGPFKVRRHSMAHHRVPTLKLRLRSMR